MTGSTEIDFDERKVQNFNVDGKLILKAGEEIVI